MTDGVPDQAQTAPVECLSQEYPQGSDEYFMGLALQAALQARALGEVPVGAVLVYQGKVLATAHNAPITGSDPTAHAEIAVLRKAAHALGNYRLVGCELYVTLEPCLMCFGALVHARINRLVYGAQEPRAGVVVSQLQLPQANFFNHQVTVKGGVLALSCSQLLKDFFAQKRR